MPSFCPASLLARLTPVQPSSCPASFMSRPPLVSYAFTPFYPTSLPSPVLHLIINFCHYNAFILTMIMHIIRPVSILFCVHPALYPSCPVSIMLCSIYVLQPSFPALAVLQTSCHPSDLPCILRVLPLPCPAIRSVLHQTSPASACIRL